MLGWKRMPSLGRIDDELVALVVASRTWKMDEVDPRLRHAQAAICYQ